MSYKEEAIRRLKKVIDEGKSVEEKVTSFLKQDLKELAERHFKEGSSLKGFVDEILEAVKGPGLAGQDKKVEKFLTETAQTLTDTFRDVSDEALERVQRLVDEAGKKFDKVVTESEGLKKIDEEAKNELEELLRELQDTAEAGRKSLKDAETALRRFTEKYGGELGSEVRAELDEIAEKANRYARQLGEKAGKYLEGFSGRGDGRLTQGPERPSGGNRKGEESNG